MHMLACGRLFREHGVRVSLYYMRSIKGGLSPGSQLAFLGKVGSTTCCRHSFLVNREIPQFLFTIDIQWSGESTSFQKRNFINCTLYESSIFPRAMHEAFQQAFEWFDANIDSFRGIAQLWSCAKRNLFAMCYGRL